MNNNNIPPFNLKPEDFGKDFTWGVSTAAYQIEGAHNLHNKGVSIWDQFTAKKGKIQNNEHGQIAVDFYHKYKEDILLMKAMHIKHFRFSLSWTRIFPNGIGAINSKGIDFYNKVIDFCLECGITPWITLYHWDLPQALQEKGGWTNRAILGWFEEYVTLCCKNFKRAYGIYRSWLSSGSTCARGKRLKEFFASRASCGFMSGIRR